MWGILFFLALFLAWPTVGISLIVYVVAFMLSVNRDRQINELKDIRRSSTSTSIAPTATKNAILAILGNIRSSSVEENAVIYHILDVTVPTRDVDDLEASGYLKSAAGYGIENIDRLATHVSHVMSTRGGKAMSNSTKEALLRSVLYWCIENAARENPDDLYLVDVGAAARKGAMSDRRLISG